MARADRRQAQRQARRVERRPRAAAGGARIAEDTMFFPKLRSHARWVFVLLAVIFATSFVFFGVGSGSGIGDLLSNWGSFFNSSGGASAQVKSDRSKIEKNPKDYAAYKDLATALATDGKLDEAIATLQKLKTLQPKDADGLTQLASLYLRKADEVRNQGVAIQSQSAGLTDASTFTPGGTSELAKAYQSDVLADPIVKAVQGQENAKLNDVYSKLTAAYSQAVAAYQDVAKISPSDPSVQFALAQTAEQANDSATAIAAYKDFLKLAPDDPTAPAVRQRVKQLEHQATASATTAGGATVTAGG
jgi:cytochrome c-type biogenesis protein CcmH/NrfG